MTQALIPTSNNTPIVVDRIHEIDANLMAFDSAQLSENTQAAYRQWFYGGSQPANYQRKSPALPFVPWCKVNNVSALPATEQVVRLYLEHLFQRGKSPATMKIARAAIRHYHEAAGHPDPTSGANVRNQVRGMNRLIADQISDGQRAEITPGMIFDIEDWTRLISVIDTKTLIGKRDLALLLLGFCGGRRRSEITGLRVEGLKFKKGKTAATIRLGKSKTDQTDTKKSMMTVINLGPLPCLDALKDWLAASKITDGSLFRRFSPQGTMMDVGIVSPDWLGEILDHYAKLAGFEGRVTWHKACRAGLINELIGRYKIPVEMVMQITGHTSAQTINEHYMGHVEANQLATLSVFNQVGRSSES